MSQTRHSNWPGNRRGTPRRLADAGRARRSTTSRFTASSPVIREGAPTAAGLHLDFDHADVLLALVVGEEAGRRSVRPECLTAAFARGGPMPDVLVRICDLLQVAARVSRLGSGLAAAGTALRARRRLAERTVRGGWLRGVRMTGEPCGAMPRSTVSLLQGTVRVLQRGSEPPIDIQQHPAEQPFDGTSPWIFMPGRFTNSGRWALSHRTGPPIRERRNSVCGGTGANGP